MDEKRREDELRDVLFHWLLQTTLDAGIDEELAEFVNGYEKFNGVSALRVRANLLFEKEKLERENGHIQPF
jgi:hypothetical protein